MCGSPNGFFAHFPRPGGGERARLGPVPAADRRTPDNVNLAIARVIRPNYAADTVICTRLELTPASVGVGAAEPLAATSGCQPSVEFASVHCLPA